MIGILVLNSQSFHHTGWLIRIPSSWISSGDQRRWCELPHTRYVNSRTMLSIHDGFSSTPCLIIGGWYFNPSSTGNHFWLILPCTILDYHLHNNDLPYILWQIVWCGIRALSFKPSPSHHHEFMAAICLPSTIMLIISLFVAPSVSNIILTITSTLL